MREGGGRGRREGYDEGVSSIRLEGRSLITEGCEDEGQEGDCRSKEGKAINDPTIEVVQVKENDEKNKGVIREVNQNEGIMDCQNRKLNKEPGQGDMQSRKKAIILEEIRGEIQKEWMEIEQMGNKEQVIRSCLSEVH